MEQEKIAKLIKQIRKEHNLTQKQLADKYNVTYQAVSKWENGLNLPDTALLKQMSKDFNISIDDILDGTYSQRKLKKIYIISGTIIAIVIIICLSVIIINSNNEGDFNFKTLSSACSSFNISGNIAYNKKKSSLYITNIQYCGGDDTEIYEEIECTLYEKHNDIDKTISSYRYNGKEKITLEDYLKTVTIAVEDYKKTCKEYTENSLYLSIDAKVNNKTTNYKIPLTLDPTCKK